MPWRSSSAAASSGGGRASDFLANDFTDARKRARAMDMSVNPILPQLATMQTQAPQIPGIEPKVVADNVNVWYGEKHALKGVSIDIPARTVTAFIGPSGCGKSTFLRCINRMNDTIAGARVEGRITL